MGRAAGITSILALALAACGGSESPSIVQPSAIAVPAGEACTEQLKLAEAPSRDHVAATQRVQYATNPPTSGEHWSAPAGPVPTGVYDRPLPDEATVHNLEHGHVIVHHNGVPEDALAQIEAIVRADPIQMVMVPRPSMDHMLALTSWTVIQVCDEMPDDPIELVRSFVQANRDNAPESIP